MTRPSPRNDSHTLGGTPRGFGGVHNAAPLTNYRTTTQNHSVPRQKWGQGCEILTASHKRRRIAAELASDPAEWDGEFGSYDDDPGCDDFDADIDELDGENPFDSIDKLLDRHEQEARQLHENQSGHYGGVEHGERVQDANAILQQDNGNDLFSCHGISIAGRDEVPTPGLAGKSSQSISMTSNEIARPHLNEESVDGHHEINVQSYERPKRSAKHYSIMKTSTPRFTFQSSVKMKQSFQTPSNRHSLPQRNLFMQSATQTSSKPVQRHTFRKSLEHDKPVVSDVRQLDCTPSFLARKRFISQDQTKDEINHDSPHKDGLSPRDSSLLESLRKSNSNDVRQSMTSRSPNFKSGYLIQRLRFLRNNDQRMAMRLRFGQYSNAFSPKIGAFMSRKRRRSESDSSDPKHTAMSELDVTVCHVGIECAFGDDKSIHVAYIHRFEKTALGTHSVGDDTKLILPCFAWIILSNDVMRKQGIADRIVVQLRAYDAVIIPTRSAMCCLRASELVKSEYTMPTIVCTNVCEPYPIDKPLPDISFDRFTKST